MAIGLNQLLHFIALHDQLTATGLDEARLLKIEWMDNLFPDLNYRNWA